MFVYSPSGDKISIAEEYLLSFKERGYTTEPPKVIEPVAEAIVEDVPQLISSKFRRGTK